MFIGVKENYVKDVPFLRVLGYTDRTRRYHFIVEINVISRGSLPFSVHLALRAETHGVAVREELKLLVRNVVLYSGSLIIVATGAIDDEGAHERGRPFNKGTIPYQPISSDFNCDGVSTIVLLIIISGHFVSMMVSCILEEEIKINEVTDLLMLDLIHV